MPSAALCTHQQTDLEHAHIKRCCPEKLCRRGVERLRSCSTPTGNTPALPWYIEHGRESSATWLSHNMTFVFLYFLAAKTIENLQHKRHCHRSHVYFVFSLNTLNNRGSCCHIIGVSATSQNNSCFLIKHLFYCFYLFRILNYLNETTWGDLLVKLLKTQNMSDLWWGVMSKWYQTKRLETTNVDSCCMTFPSLQHVWKNILFPAFRNVQPCICYLLRICRACVWQMHLPAHWKGFWTQTNVEISYQRDIRGRHHECVQ